MNSLLLPAAFAIPLAGGSAVAVLHGAAVHGDTMTLAEGGGGSNGGLDRHTVETAEGGGGGNGGFDRRITEQA